MKQPQLETCDSCSHLVDLDKSELMGNAWKLRTTATNGIKLESVTYAMVVINLMPPDNATILIKDLAQMMRSCSELLVSQSSLTVGTLISKETVFHAETITNWKEILASGKVLLFNAEIDKSMLMVYVWKLTTTVKPGMRVESAVDAMVATISTPPGNATTFLKVTANQMKCCILGNV